MGLKVLYRELRPADIVLIIILLASIAVSGFSLWRGDRPKTVSVYKNDQLWAEFDIREDRVIIIDSHNTLEIRNGKVGMIEADCPDRRCVKQGFGSILPIICLPNHVMIEIHGDDREAPYILY